MYNSIDTEVKNISDISGLSKIFSIFITHN